MSLYHVKSITVIIPAYSTSQKSVLHEVITITVTDSSAIINSPSFT